VLLGLTLVVIAVVVVVLAGYLVAIAVALGRARQNVARLADGLEAVAGQVGPLGDRVTPINAALVGLLGALGAVDGHLVAMARILRG
jgi:hypothetical protein